MNINDTINAMLSEFPGWEWLVRSDGEGAFANFHPPETDWEDGEDCFPCWSTTPENALGASLAWAKAARDGDVEFASGLILEAKARRSESLPS